MRAQLSQQSHQSVVVEVDSTDRVVMETLVDQVVVEEEMPETLVVVREQQIKEIVVDITAAVGVLVVVDHLHKEDSPSTVRGTGGAMTQMPQEVL